MKTLKTSLALSSKWSVWLFPILKSNLLLHLLIIPELLGIQGKTFKDSHSQNLPLSSLSDLNPSKLHFFCKLTQSHDAILCFIYPLWFIHLNLVSFKNIFIFLFSSKILPNFTQYRCRLQYVKNLMTFLILRIVTLFCFQPVIRTNNHSFTVFPFFSPSMPGMLENTK